MHHALVENLMTTEPKKIPALNLRLNQKSKSHFQSDSSIVRDCTIKLNADYAFSA
jgi:hypothetical protein